MRIEHVAVWTSDPHALERVRAFYETYFATRAGARYESARRAGFLSYFLEFPGGGASAGARLELMTAPGLVPPSSRDAVGYAHVAVAVGSRAAVDALVARMAGDGVTVESAPRLTGDGYYEAVVRDPDGNLVEITA